ncbi:acetyltransferase [Roseateles chitinivorans]|uniref:acetyltransferase n=1 Tax=Roseateles chitinivorans TaxID=2917965 RepID=UPI003D671475
MSIASPAQAAGRLLSHIAGQPFETVLEGAHLTVKPLDGSSPSTWMLEDGAPLPSLQARHGLGVGQGAAVLADLHLPAALEALFALRPELPTFALGDALPASAALVRTGIALPTGATAPAGLAHPATTIMPTTVSRELFWQWDRLWLADRRDPAPVQYVFSKDGRRHPRRPAKPTGTVYRRHIPWLDKTFSLRALDVDRDLATVNRWMNEPAVARRPATWSTTGATCPASPPTRTPSA